MSLRVLLCAALAVLGVLFALLVGAESASVVRALTDPGSLDHALVVEVRLPRALLALVVGAGLGASGAALQALLRNPLAEPYVLGVSGGSALAATLALMAGSGAMTAWLLPMTTFAALAGGLLVTAVLLPLLRKFSGQSAKLLLIGIVVNAWASALITLIKTLASAHKAQELLFWLTGFLEVPTFGALALTAAMVAIGIGALLLDARALDVIALGEASAHGLGVDVRRLALRTFVASSWICAAVVSISGMIGFVGLLVPHAARLLGLRTTRHLLLGSALLGGGTLALCDGLTRALFVVVHSELPVGALTALIGGPLFVFLLIRRTQAA